MTSLFFLTALSVASAADVCETVPTLTTTDSVWIEVDATGATTIPFGPLTLKGIEGEDIDLRSGCQPQIKISGVPLEGIEPDEIDLSVSIAFSGQAHTREHILLSRQVEVPALVEELPAGLVLEAVEGTFREEVLSYRPYASRVVLDLTFNVVDHDEDPDLVIEAIEMAADSSTDEGDALMPEVPVCGHCLPDISK